MSHPWHVALPVVRAATRSPTRSDGSMEQGKQRDLQERLQGEPARLGRLLADARPDDRDNPHEQPADLIRVPGYEVLDRLGEGAMGTVWRAVQVSAGRQVALKLIGAGGIG